MSPYYRALREKIGHDLLLYPGVGAVIPDEAGRILLQEKSSGEGWSIPGGGIEPGEHPEAALKREVREETGLVVRTERILLVVGGSEYRYQYPNGDRVEFTGLIYLCSVIGRSSGPLILRRDRFAIFRERRCLHWQCHIPKTPSFLR